MDREAKILFLIDSDILPLFSDFEKMMQWLLIRGHSVSFIHLPFTESRQEHRTNLQKVITGKWFEIIFISKGILDTDPDALMNSGDRIFILKEDGNTPEEILLNVEKITGR